MSKTLYDEAIAEARQLRDLAEKNAKQAIVEAVTPKIRKFIEDQLINSSHDSSSMTGQSLLEHDMSDLVSEELQGDVILDESALNTLIRLTGPVDELDEPIKRKFFNAFSDSADLIGTQGREKLLEITRKLQRDIGTLSSDGIVISQELNSINIKENSEMSRNRETLYEVDLSDIVSGLYEDKHEEPPESDEAAMREMLAELEEEAMAGEGGLYEYDLFEQDEDEDEDVPVDEPLPEEEDVPEDVGAPEGDLPPDVDLALDDLESAILAALGGEAPLEGEEFEAEEGEEAVEELAEVLDVDLGMLRSEISRMRHLAEAGHEPVDEDKDDDDDDDDDDVPKQEGVVIKENRKLRRAILNQGRNNRTLRSKLDEYRSAVESLREQLTEMNLFNAKLLYVNKMLQNRDVSSAQRRSIIEALDSARSLREVKLLYKSLTESIVNRKSGRTLTESAVRRNLGSASRATTQASATNNQVAEVGRWAKLAGITG